MVKLFENRKYRLSNNNNISLYILWFFVSFLLLHVCILSTNILSFDDLFYIEIAHAASLKPSVLIHTNDQLSLRWFIIIVTAFLYKFFGVNSFTTMACCLVVTILTGYVLYRIIRQQKPAIVALVLGFYFLNYQVIYSAHRLFPDPVMCLLIFAAFVVYAKSKRLLNTAKYKYGAGFALLLFLCFITKETIVITLPLWLYLFCKDVFDKKEKQFWVAGIITGFCLLAAYFIFFYLVTGDWFYRYHILQENAYFNKCSYDELPFAETLKRIGYGLWRTFLLNGDMMLILPAIVAFFYKKKLAEAGIKIYYLKAFVILLASANFMSVSFKSYIPLCPEPRHFSFVYPFAALATGYMLYVFWQKPKAFILLPIAMSLATMAIFLMDGGGTKYLYLAFSVFLIARYSFTQNSIQHKAFGSVVCSVLFLFLLKPAGELFKPATGYIADQKQILEQQNFAKNGQNIVYSTDDFTNKAAAFFLHFDTTNAKAVNIVSAEKLDTAGNFFLLINTMELPNIKPQIDSVLQTQTAGNNIQLISENNNCSFYKINTLAWLNKIRNIGLQAKQQMEFIPRIIELKQKRIKQ